MSNYFLFQSKFVLQQTSVKSIRENFINAENAIYEGIETLLINKDDIKLYIDLNELSSDNTCKIKYESKYDIEKINIEPDIVTVEKLEIQ